MSASSNSTYAEHLISQGHNVIEIDGVPWMNYCGALITATAMPVYIKPPRDEAVRAIRQAGVLFLRCTTGPRETAGYWWHIVCRRYDFNSVSSNTRSKIRRGLKRMEIRQVNPEWLIENGYPCHLKSHARYKNASPQSREEFRSFLSGLRNQSIFDIWACTRDEELLGYILCLREADGVFMHTIDISPAGLRDYAAYAMIHHLLEYYVNGKGIPVSNGSRSVSHATEMQEFLCKFGFVKEYCDLHVIYRPSVGVIVRMLYPFRGILGRFTSNNLIHKISATLFQEEILRLQHDGQRT